MAASEEFLGVITDVVRSVTSTDEIEYQIYLTNFRVIFAHKLEFKPTKPRFYYDDYDIDVAIIDDEIKKETQYSRSPDRILRAHRLNFAVNYNDFNSFEVNREYKRTNIDFDYKGHSYRFLIPNYHFDLVERWEELIKRFKKLQNCPNCGYVLKGPLKYCRRCDKNYGVYTSDLRTEFLEKERYVATKEDKQTGVILAFFGFLMSLIILAVLYPMFQFNSLVVGAFCLPLPIFFVILGVLVFFGKRSGKLIFGIICIVFGGTAFVVMMMSVLGYIRELETNPYYDLAFEAMGVGILIYGLYLVRNSM